MSFPHEKLVAWQRADDFLVQLYTLTNARFPTDERYGSTAQGRRSAYSVCANIVESFCRQHAGERLQFLHVGWGSLAEATYCLHVARRVGYIDEATYRDCETEARHVAAPLKGLMNHVAQQTKLKKPARST